MMAVLSGHLFVIALLFSRCLPMLTRHDLTFRCSRVNAAMPAVIAGAIAVVVVDDHRSVDVDVVDHGSVHVGHRGIVTIDVAVPAATDVSGAVVSKAVVN